MRIVFTNGCFDLLSLPHLMLFEQAARLGDKLIVGINSDGSVRRLKGPGRPFFPAWYRVKMVKACRWVGEVAVFDEDTPINLIERLRPAILVKGADYLDVPIVGEEFVLSYGGEVHRFKTNSEHKKQAERLKGRIYAADQGRSSTPCCEYRGSS